METKLQGVRVALFVLFVEGLIQKTHPNQKSMTILQVFGLKMVGVTYKKHVEHVIIPFSFNLTFYLP